MQLTYVRSPGTHRELCSDVHCLLLLLLNGSLAHVSIDPDCAYGVLQGEAKGFMPIGHDVYEVIIEARKLKAK